MTGIQKDETIRGPMITVPSEKVIWQQSTDICSVWDPGGNYETEAEPMTKQGGIEKADLCQCDRCTNQCPQQTQK